ncbi:hypothetical protein BKA25_003970 [Actinoalloteichus hymeniacidonis]|nr:hypothetical protein [Actinoalloteichus hymeniacidonis]
MTGAGLAEAVGEIASPPAVCGMGSVGQKRAGSV